MLEQFVARKYVILVAFAAVLYLAFSIPQLQQPFLYDDLGRIPVYMAQSGNPIIPVFYDGELQNKYALWHPPTLIYVLTGFVLAFGENLSNEVAERIPSFLFFLFTIALIYFVSKSIFAGRKDSELIGAIGAVIYAFMPAARQGSLILDIDNNVFPLFVLIFALVLSKDNTKKKWAFLTGFLFVSFWFKIGITILLIASAVLYYIFNREFKISAKMVGIGFLSFVLFFATWFLYTEALNLPFLFPFQKSGGFVSDSFFGMISDPIKFASGVGFYLYKTIIWTTPQISLLMLLGAFYIFKDKQSLQILSLLFAPLIFYTFIHQLSDGFPRYNGSILPLVAIVASYGAMRIYESFDKKFLAAGFAVTSVYVLFFMGDPYIYTYYFSNYYSQLVEKSLLTFSILFLPLVICSAILFLEKGKIVPALVVGSLLSFAIVAVHLGLTQATADYYTHRFYGQTGLVETAGYVKENTNTSDLIYAQTDIGFYSQRKFYSSFAPVGQKDLSEELEKLKTGEIKFAVLTDKEIAGNEISNPQSWVLVKENYKQVAKFGFYNVHKFSR